MGDVVDCCATTRRAITKWTSVLYSSCQTGLETRWMNWLIVVGALKVGGENQLEWELFL